MSEVNKNLGHATAYGYAKSKGYTGTEEQFAELMASYADVAEDAAQSASEAAQSATAAAASATNAASSASGATQSAQSASASATSASQSATAATSAVSTAQTAAQTATTKASEASQSATNAASSATTANSAADDATAAKTAAETAKTTAQQSATSAATSAQTAQDVLESIPEDYSDLSNDVDDLKSAFNASALPSKHDYSFHGYINAVAGAYYANESYRTTDFVECGTDSVIQLFDIATYTSSLAYAFYDETKTYISGQNNVIGDVTVTTIPSNAKYVRFSTELTTNTPEAYVFNEKVTEEELKSLEDFISNGGIAPKNTTFFEGVNWFDSAKVTLYTDRYVAATGVVTFSNNSCTMVIPVKPNTDYVVYIPNSNRAIIAESTDDNFTYGQSKTPIYTSGRPASGQVPFTTGASAKYVGIYFNSEVYDWDANKNNIILNIDFYNGTNPPYIAPQYLPKTLTDVLYDKNLLIFGDSITDCCALTINSNKETTAYTWRNPSNSYVNGQGTTVSYSMWAKILKENQNFKEIRNYAYTGASYKTQTRAAGDERQNVQYQIDVAMNDLDNPHNVFAVNDFVPDIVIFALGTNDSAPNDTYDSAMSATVFSGATIDTSATMAALDETKTIASARKAFMRIKQAFPMAQIYCVMPIQRADNDTNLGTLHEYLKQMAQRYGCIIIDGTYDSGITRDFNVSGGLGTYLKDGLHPNEKGQNLMARMILTSLKTHFIPFGNGFNS